MTGGSGEAVPETRSLRRVVAPIVVTLAIAVVVVSFAIARSSRPPRLSADDAPPAAAPADDTVLAQGAWPEVAAYVRKQSGLGRPTVVKFFASWCEPCKVETPHVVAVARANPDVAFIGVAHEDRRAPAEAFVEEYGVTVMPTILDDLGETAREVGVLGMPGVAFFSTDGELVGVHVGPISEERLQEWLDGLAGRGRIPDALA